MYVHSYIIDYKMDSVICESSFSFFKFQASQKELADLSQALENERYRAERLEAQVNDLTELHQVIKAIFTD